MRAEAGQVEHPERLGPRTRATVRMSRWATPRVVERALAAGERVADRVDRILARSGLDAILLPVLPTPPPPLGMLHGLGSVRSLLASTPLVGCCAIFNVSGPPALSMPAARSREGWPVGGQLVARRGCDGLLLAVAAQLERETPWPTPVLGPAG